MTLHTPAPEKKPGLVGLVFGIVQDARSLMRQEVQLLRDEVKLEVSKAGRVASEFGIGIGLLAIGGVLLLFMLVYGLHDLTGLPLWASYGSIGVLLVAGGGALLARARILAEDVHTTPHRTVLSLKEDAQWIKKKVVSKKM
jgi:hypothetical protein